MFLAIFSFLGSAQYVICLCASWSFNPYFVVFDSFREEKRSQSEKGHLIGGQIGTIYSKKPSLILV